MVSSAVDCYKLFNKIFKLQHPKLRMVTLFQEKRVHKHEVHILLFILNEIICLVSTVLLVYPNTREVFLEDWERLYVSGSFYI